MLLDFILIRSGPESVTTKDGLETVSSGGESMSENDRVV